jgi:hypothetical protein
MFKTVSKSDATTVVASPKCRSLVRRPLKIGFWRAVISN